MLATIEIISAIYPHPNADSLEFVKVLGYNCIVKKSYYQLSEKVILIQPDTVLPDDDWTKLYKQYSPNRVRAIKLRGAYSFGIVEKLSLLSGEGSHYNIGQEVSGELGITKYAPMLPEDIQALGLLPPWIKTTDEERYQNINLENLYGQLVDVTLKLDGASVSYYYKDGALGVLGRNYEIKPDSHNRYTYPLVQHNIFEKLTTYCQKYKVNLALRGELYGKGIQTAKHNYHSQIDKNVAFYNTYLIDDKEYATPDHPHYFTKVCEELDLPTVPILESCVPLTPELIQKYDEQLTQVMGHPFEGIVIKGVDDNNRYFSFKVINKYYDSKK